eukprot:GHVQ01017345.1.p1 GENE.GHVQ01017345.1~~GHVQ01017345.1.p1  ORF type:complete len:441 (+),score=68.15 GHVQ01017345.1:357-1679(+)
MANPFSMDETERGLGVETHTTPAGAIQNGKKEQQEGVGETNSISIRPSTTQHTPNSSPPKTASFLSSLFSKSKTSSDRSQANDQTSTVHEPTQMGGSVGEPRVEETPAAVPHANVIPAYGVNAFYALPTVDGGGGQMGGVTAGVGKEMDAGTQPSTATGGNTPTRPISSPSSSPRPVTLCLAIDGERREGGEGEDGVGGGLVVLNSSRFFTTETSHKLRQEFVRKEFMLLSVSSMITFLVTLLFTIWREATIWLRSNGWFMWVCLVFGIVLIIVLAIFRRVAKIFPLSLIVVLLLGGIFGVVLGYVVTVSGSVVVSTAAAQVVIIVIVLCILGFQHMLDVTGMLTYLVVLLLTALQYGLSVAIFRFYSSWSDLLYAAIGVYLVCTYIVFHMQRVVGGRHIKHRFAVKQWSFAALCLYLDVVSCCLALGKYLTCGRCCRRF